MFDSHYIFKSYFYTVVRKIRYVQFKFTNYINIDDSILVSIVDSLLL